MKSFAFSHRPTAAGPAPRPGFTLVELVVVIVIVLILLGLILPASRTMWNERKVSEAENALQGLLMVARADALKAGGIETGLLFYVDERGTQRVVSIRRAETTEPYMQHVFVVAESRVQEFPKPMRVVPRWVAVEDPANPLVSYGAPELANEDFFALPGGVNQAQRHRNFFTMVYSSAGHLLVRRDVLIQDADVDGDMVGDVTGLPVRYQNADPPKATVKEYWRQDDTKWPLDHPPAAQGVLYLLADDNDVALNVPSVDGLLVYDDALFTGLDDAEDQRAFLLRSAKPYYVSRLTGAVIEGPIGEGPTS